MAEPASDGPDVVNTTDAWVWVSVATFPSQSEAMTNFTDLPMEDFLNQADCKAPTRSAS